MGRKKKIRKVTVNSREYYVYDVVVNTERKVQRIYGKSENEVRQKIEAMGYMDANTEFSFEGFEPDNGTFSEYATYYFKKSLGNLPIQELRHLIVLFGNTVSKTEFDIQLKDYTEKKLKKYFNNLTDNYTEKDVKLMYDTFRNIFNAANKAGITQNITVPVPDYKKIADASTVEYILSPEEYDKLKAFCLQDDCVMYGKNEQIVLLALFTGIKVNAMKDMLIKDVNLESGVITADDIKIKISDECREWLISQVRRGRLAAVGNNGEILPYYGADISSDDEQGGVNNDKSISRYTLNKNDLFFVNSNNRFPTTQSIYFTLQRMSLRMGLPKGIFIGILFKSYIIYELSKGVTIAKLQKRFQIRNPKKITDIQDEYAVKKALFG